MRDPESCPGRLVLYIRTADGTTPEAMAILRSTVCGGIAQGEIVLFPGHPSIQGPRDRRNSSFQRRLQTSPAQRGRAVARREARPLAPGFPKSPAKHGRVWRHPGCWLVSRSVMGWFRQASSRFADGADIGEESGPPRRGDRAVARSGREFGGPHASEGTIEKG